MLFSVPIRAAAANPAASPRVKPIAAGPTKVLPFDVKEAISVCRKPRVSAARAARTQAAAPQRNESSAPKPAAAAEAVSGEARHE